METSGLDTTFREGVLVVGMVVVVV